MRRTLTVFILWLLVPGSLTAQHAHSPYAGDQEREIKALADDEIDGLLEGAGLGMALAAELNGYPGPRHVLELADELELSPEQRARTEEIFAAMKEQAMTLGAQVVEKERALDAAFVEQKIDEEALARLVEEIGALRADLRLAHLSAHLQMFALLTHHQRMLYAELRGYGSPHHEDGAR